MRQGLLCFATRGFFSAKHKKIAEKIENIKADGGAKVSFNAGTGTEEDNIDVRLRTELT